MTKKFFSAALFVGAVWVLVNFFFSLHFEFLEPAHTLSEKFSVKDIYYRHVQSEQVEFNDQVVLVDIDTLKRAGILQLLNAVEQCKPNAIGVDILFPDLHEEDPLTDAALMQWAQSHPNAVFAVKAIAGSDSLRQSFFMEPAGNVKRGMVNFGTERPDLPVRTLLNHHRKDTGLRSFASRIFEVAGGAQQLAKEMLHQDEIEIIYRRIKFTEINANELLLQPGQYSSLLQGRTVLIGALQDMSDLHITPYIGKADPEQQEQVPGMQIHARALANFISGERVQESWLFDLFFLLLLFVITVYAMVYMEEKHHYYVEVFAKALDVGATLLLFLLYILLFDRFYFSFDIGQAILIVLLAAELVKLDEPLISLVMMPFRRARRKKAKAPEEINNT